MPGIKYITESDKPYPIWMKQHKVFKEMDQIEKIWPSIGLPNLVEEVEINSSEAARLQANLLGRDIYSQLTEATRLLISQTKTVNRAPGESKERNEKCNDIQCDLNTISALCNSLHDMYYNIAEIKDKKVNINLHYDVFNGVSSKPIFKKGEAFIGVLTKVNGLIAKHLPYNLLHWENLSSFKEFSKLNLSGKKRRLHFSSTGEDGAWNIATASMRGITSCQGWTAIQSRGLIGSISSKYVGVCFIEGEQDFPPYGKQMTFRAMVRLVVNRQTGMPIIYADTLYPSANPEVLAAMREFFTSRTGLPFMAASQGADKGTVGAGYAILDEPSRAFLKEGEYSYMDTPLPVEKIKPGAVIILEANRLAIRRMLLQNKLNEIITNKKTQYVDYVNKVKAIKEGEEAPKFDHLFQDLERGQYAIQNMLNFFKHFTRNDASTNDPVRHFSDEIFKAIGTPDHNKLSDREIDMWILKTLVGNSEKIRTAAEVEIAKGSWMKSFPKASTRFLNTLMADLKVQLMTQIKADKNVA